MKLKVLKSREAQIGLLIAVILALFIWGFNFLKGRNLLTPANYYYCEFEDVGGLMESNFVMVRGFKVGLVENIELSDDNSKLIVTMVLEDEKLKIPKGSKAVLYDLDLLGTKAVKLELVPGRGSYYENGDTLPSNIDKGMLGGLEDQLGPVKEKIAEYVKKLDDLIADSTINHLSTSVANLDATTESIKNQLGERGDLTATIRNLRRITQDLNNSETGLKATLTNVNAITDSLASSDLKLAISRIDTAVASLNSILVKVVNNEGSLGNLVNDKALYANLNATTESLDKLLTDMQQQPSKYVHLSLIDWGKDVYIDENGVTRNVDDNTYFSVLVKQTSNAVNIDTENFTDPSVINEHQQKGVFYYSIGNFKDYSSAIDAADKIRQTYPSAEVITFNGNKIVSLKKAIK
ncbi:MlaD family protein [Saccharicrinis sp. FJH62]|uniref:MlaD family protein n=1 Tax=Saccharicrinis sp. FJH62 TaxID=3344657 RepID=UPI0035D4C303